MSSSPPDNRVNRLRLRDRPWLPLWVSAVTLVLPAGGAILTVWNLRRLGQLNSADTWRLGAVITVLLALGLAALLLVSPVRRSGQPTPDDGTLLVVDVGTAVASFLVQRAPYSAWRSRNPTQPTMRFIDAVGYAFMFEVAVILTSIVIYSILAVLT